jgi:hypothetical protein
MNKFERMKLEDFQKFLNKRLEITFYEHLEDGSKPKKIVGSLSIDNVGIGGNNSISIPFMFIITEQKTENSFRISKRQIVDIILKG